MSKYDSRNKPIREHRIGLDIIREGDYIYLRTKKGYVFRTYYEKELFELLATNRISWDCNVNSVVRLQYEVNYRHKACKGVMRKDLAWLIWGYYQYNVRKNNLCTSLKNMQRELNGACIDHLDNDRTNNCISNLTVTSIPTNTHKGRTFDKLTQAPFKLVVAHRGDRIKAILFRLGGGLDISPVITENSLESLVSLVRQYMQESPYNTFESVLENYNRNKQVSEVERINDNELQQILYDNFDDELVGIRLAFRLMELGEVEGCCIPYQSTQMYSID